MSYYSLVVLYIFTARPIFPVYSFSSRPSSVSTLLLLHRSCLNTFISRQIVRVTCLRTRGLSQVQYSIPGIQVLAGTDMASTPNPRRGTRANPAPSDNREVLGNARPSSPLTPLVMSKYPPSMTFMPVPLPKTLSLKAATKQTKNTSTVNRKSAKPKATKPAANNVPASQEAPLKRTSDVNPQTPLRQVSQAPEQSPDTNPRSRAHLRRFVTFERSPSITSKRPPSRPLVKPRKIKYMELSDGDTQESPNQRRKAQLGNIVHLDLNHSDNNPQVKEICQPMVF